MNIKPDYSLNMTNINRILNSISNDEYKDISSKIELIKSKYSKSLNYNISNSSSSILKEEVNIKESKVNISDIIKKYKSSSTIVEIENINKVDFEKMKIDVKEEKTEDYKKICVGLEQEMKKNECECVDKEYNNIVNIVNIDQIKDKEEKEDKEKDCLDKQNNPIQNIIKVDRIEELINKRKELNMKLKDIKNNKNTKTKSNNDSKYRNDMLVQENRTKIEGILNNLISDSCLMIFNYENKYNNYNGNDKDKNYQFKVKLFTVKRTKNK